MKCRSGRGNEIKAGMEFVTQPAVCVYVCVSMCVRSYITTYTHEAAGGLVHWPLYTPFQWIGIYSLAISQMDI